MYAALGAMGYIATSSDPTEHWELSYQLPTKHELFSISYIDDTFVVIADWSLIFVGN